MAILLTDISVINNPIQFSDTPPGNPLKGDEWVETTTGIRYVYFKDDNSSKWVQFDANQQYGPTYNVNNNNKNRIINGGMSVDQRNSGASHTITAGSALVYTVDRWYAYCTGADVTGQQVSNTGAITNPSKYAYQFTGAASVTAIGFAQRIEEINCFDLAGTTATLSVNLANSLLTTVTWTAYYANTSDTFGTLASPTRTQIATGSFTVNSAMTRYSTTMNIPEAATTGIEIVFSVGAQTSGTWQIGNVQLEAGTSVSPFEYRLIGQELLMCHRYYTQSTETWTVYSGTGFMVIPLNFNMITSCSPTVTKTAGSGTLSISGGDYNGPNAFRITSSSATNDFTWTASAEL